MQTYAGIDLHSSNNYIGIIDGNDKRLYSKRHDNNLKQVIKALEPFEKNLQGIAIESTYNWYWLVDGLQEHGFNVHLANPAAIQAYSGLKHTDDKWDSFWLAHMLRLGILPQGYIYPKQHRSMRDLLRRRLMFVRQRTSQILSLQSMITRNRGLNYTGTEVKRFRDEFIDVLFSDPHLVFTAKRNLATIKFLDRIVGEIETEVNSQLKLKKQFRMLLTTPGIGNILAMTIMLEVGDIGRFAKAGNYSSYCRCVESKKISNGKKKGKTTRKTATAILLGHMWRRQTMQSDLVAERKDFFNAKCQRTNGLLPLRLWPIS